MDEMKVRVLLVDDHALVRDGLRHLIDDQPDMQVVAEAADGPEAVRLCEAVRPHVALVDVSMPVWDGVKTVQMLRSTSPGTRIISLTRHDHESFVRRMLGAGVAGYVLKQSSPTELPTVIRAVVRGERYVDPSARSSPIQRAPEAQSVAVGDEGPPAEKLSLQEEQVLRLVALTRSGPEIAGELGLDLDTVMALKSRAMAKLGLRSRVQVVGHALNSGWQEADQER